MNKEQIMQYYLNAKAYIEQNHPELICTIEQDCFVTQLNWQNVTYFNGRGLTHSSRTYRNIVKIRSNGDFYMIDVYINNDSSIGLDGLQIDNSYFGGKSLNFTSEVMFGKDNNTGEVGVQTYTFNTSDIQKPIKDYFQGMGLNYRFFSYELVIKALPSIGRLIVVGLPLCVGGIFTLLGINLLDEPVIGLVFTSLGIIALLWGIINLICLKKKDE